jgi:RimJ/RimL family protein N-acetyltransferase
MVTFLDEAVLAFDDDQWWGYSLFEVASGEFVGSAVLRRMSETEPEGLEIGYWVRSDRTRRGYATSATAALIDAAFTRLTGIERIRISMDVANAASAAVPRKLGFDFQGEVKRDVAAGGHSSSSAIWELARST